MNRSFTILLFLVLTAANSFAQHVSPARETAIKYAQANWQKLGLLAEDVADLVVTDEFTTAHNGATHVWLGQRFQGIPVYNGLFQITVKKDGSVLTIAHRWAKDLAHKTNSLNNAVSVKNALLKSLQLLDIQGVEPRLKTNPAFGKFTFDKETWSTWDVPAELVFQPMAKGKPSLATTADELRLAWSFQIQGANDIHFWHIRIDAVTGELLEKMDHAAHDHFAEANETHNPNEVSYLEKQACKMPELEAAPLKEMAGALASYNVFALPTESPIHGPRVVVEDPADLAASPFGWHDTNGVAGAESTRTQGNNVRAYSDDNGDNNPATPVDTPDGGPGLVFDGPFDPNNEPEDQSDAGVINLFYMNNMLHDYCHAYGFDEVSGNFQTKNYSNSGAGNDPVLAEARDNQFGTNPSTNNANFSTPADGGSGRMQMFIWNQAAAVGGNLQVTAPNQIAGSVQTSTGNWGAPITDVPVCGKVEIVDDGSNDPTFGCVSPLLNDLTGKIALIDRQKCEFGLKALNAEQAGAIGAIIVNFENAFLNMGAGAVGAQVTIPVVMIQSIDGSIIRQFATAGTLEVCIVQPTVTGPAALDGDLDNGIIAHEFGHGLSNRLVGGPSNAGCLGNAEQMGEGMGDLMSLMMTARVGDTGPKPRGVGTYVQREDPITGKGIRNFPYSTDLVINPLSYADMATNTEVHATGEIFASVIWEVYWRMVDKYGFDADLAKGNGGNNKTTQLFFDAMKLVPCSPGFLDFRDAMFAADEINFGGIHNCLLWEAFAKRGMGVDALQGDADNASDQTAGFEPLPTCIAELKIKKSVDKDLINPGETVNVTIDIVNHKPGPVTGVVVTDELPDGMSYVAGSATNGGVWDAANKVVKWELGTIATLGEKKLTYQAGTSTVAPYKSTRYYFDDMENGDANWGFDVTVGDGSILWSQTNILAYSGATSWFAEESPAALDITLNYVAPIVITGANSTARFWHRYDSEAGADGGFVEISVDGSNWKAIKKSEYLRRAPFGIQYATFVLANLSAYSGDSQEWVDSYIDLTAYTGKEVRLRWRFGCDDNTAAGDGWFVDDVEIMNLFKYDGTATITSNEGDNVDAKAPNQGIFVNSDGSVGTSSLAENVVGLQANPNPANEMLYLSLSGEPIGDSRVSLVSVDGRVVKTMDANFQSPTQIVPLDLVEVVSGVYFVRVESAKGSGVVKVVVR